MSPTVRKKRNEPRETARRFDSLNPLFNNAAQWFTQARGSSVNALTVEKDFWVTELLRAISEPVQFDAPNENAYPVTARAVFKGGTSLSKAHGIIDRFSEDIDIYLQVSATPDTLPAAFARSGHGDPPAFVCGKSRVDTIFKNIADRVGKIVGVTPTTLGAATARVKRAFAYDYPRGADAAQWSTGLKEGVQLELVRMGTPTPNAPHQLKSMLSEWATHTGTLVQGEWEELEPFSIDVLAPSRTLVDKLCILHDRGVRMEDRRMPSPGYSARHYCDVYQLLGNQSVIDSIDAEAGLVMTYAEQAAKDSADAKRDPEPLPVDGFASSPAYTSSVLALAAPDYTAEMSRLGYGTYPTLQQVADRVRDHAHRLAPTRADEPDMRIAGT